MRLALIGCLVTLAGAGCTQKPGDGGSSSAPLPDDSAATASTAPVSPQAQEEPSQDSSEQPEPAYLEGDAVGIPSQWNPETVETISVASARSAIEDQDYTVVAYSAPDPEKSERPEVILPGTLGSDGSYILYMDWWPAVASPKFGLSEQEMQDRGADQTLQRPDGEAMVLPDLPPLLSDTVALPTARGPRAGSESLLARRGDVFIGMDTTSREIATNPWRVFTWDTQTGDTTVIAAWDQVCDRKFLPYQGYTQQVFGATSTHVLWSAITGAEIGDRCDETVLESSAQVSVLSRKLDGTGSISILVPRSWLFAVDGDTIYYAKDGYGFGDPLDPRWEIHRISPTGEDTVIASGVFPAETVGEDHLESIKYGIQGLTAENGTVAWRVIHSRRDTTLDRHDARIYVQHADARTMIIYENDPGDTNLTLSTGRLTWSGTDPGMTDPELWDTGQEEQKDPSTYILDLDNGEFLRVDSCGECLRPDIAGDYVLWHNNQEPRGMYYTNTLAHLPKNTE
jgi:hypothetical protein